MKNLKDIEYMKLALKEAKKCIRYGDVPVGAIIVKNNKIIAKGYNKRVKNKNIIYHAEMVALEKACKKMKNWNLEDAILYTTLEPCIMCSGAIIQAHIKKVIYGAKSEKSGADGSIIKLLDNKKYSYKVLTKSGACEEECSNLLKEYFKNMRKIKDKSKNNKKR